MSEWVSDGATYRAVPLFSEGQLKSWKKVEKNVEIVEEKKVKKMLTKF